MYIVFILLYMYIVQCKLYNEIVRCTYYTISETCADNNDFDPRQRKCVKCDQSLDKGYTQKTTRCMKYGITFVII